MTIYGLLNFLDRSCSEKKLKQLLRKHWEILPIFRKAADVVRKEVTKTVSAHTTEFF